KFEPYSSISSYFSSGKPFQNLTKLLSGCRKITQTTHFSSLSLSLSLSLSSINPLRIPFSFP
ncbi:hypothetical protein ACOSB0_00020, partial [Candidatus Phytoplasma citri]